MNIDIPDHVVFRIEVDNQSKDFCLSCAIKLMLHFPVKPKAICSTGEFDKCDDCGMYL